MHSIRKKILIIETAIYMWFIILFFLFRIISINDYIIIYWVFQLVITILLIFLLVRFCRIYKHARLIVENSIIRITSALIKNDHVENIETFISCFGLLIDSKVIKYNTGNISLKSVEINSEFVCISYGKGEKIQRAYILHGKINGEELQLISKRFHYETGITPILKK